MAPQMTAIAWERQSGVVPVSSAWSGDSGIGAWLPSRDDPCERFRVARRCGVGLDAGIHGGEVTAEELEDLVRGVALDG